MFRSSENLRLAADMRALQKVAGPWRESRTTWFDGSPDSVVARIAATDRVLTAARSGFTPAHLELTREAESARRELVGARDRLFTDFLDDGARSPRVAGFNDTHAIITEHDTAQDAYLNSGHPVDKEYLDQVRDELHDRARQGDPDAIAWAGGGSNVDVDKEQDPFDPRLIGASRTAAAPSWNGMEAPEDECLHCGGEVDHIDVENGECPTCGEHPLYDKDNVAEMSRWERHPDDPIDHEVSRYEDEGMDRSRDWGHLGSRSAAIDFLADQNTNDRQELLFRAHRHASDRTGQLPVPTAQRVVQAFVGAVSREIGRTAAEDNPEDRECEDCGAEAGEKCRPWCTGEAAHNDEKKSKKTSSIADFDDELMFFDPS